MSILSHAAPCVKPSDAEQLFADHLAYAADHDDDFEGWTPGWQDQAYEPDPVDAAEERGYQVGVEGGNLHSDDVFPGDHDARTDGRLQAFYRGRRAGLGVHARRVGYDLGQYGMSADRPASVTAGFRAEFEAGYAAGWADYCERQRIMADYFRDLDREQELWNEEQENRSRMGWPTPAAWCPVLEA